MTRNDSQKNNDLELAGFEDALFAESAPETKWRDISGDVMAEIKRQALNAFIRSAIAALFIIIIGTPFSSIFLSHKVARENIKQKLQSPVRIDPEFLIASQEIDGMEPGEMGRKRDIYCRHRYRNDVACQSGRC